MIGVEGLPDGLLVVTDLIDKEGLRREAQLERGEPLGEVGSDLISTEGLRLEEIGPAVIQQVALVGN